MQHPFGGGGDLRRPRRGRHAAARRRADPSAPRPRGRTPAVHARPARLRGGGGGLTHLAYRTREPNDIAYYLRSNKIYWRGVGVMARVEQLDYWDGEE